MKENQLCDAHAAKQTETQATQVTQATQDVRANRPIGVALDAVTWFFPSADGPICAVGTCHGIPSPRRQLVNYLNFTLIFLIISTIQFNA